MAAAAARKIEQITDSLLTNPSNMRFNNKLEERFPNIDPLMRPFGDLCLVQIRRPNKFTDSGIEIDTGSRATEYYNTQIAKVLFLGDLCFKTVRHVGGKDVLIDWPEGPWFKVGDFVRVPQYGGNRFSIKAMIVELRRLLGMNDEIEYQITEDVIFAYFRVKDVQGVVTGDPCSINAFHD